MQQCRPKHGVRDWFSCGDQWWSGQCSGKWRRFNLPCSHPFQPRPNQAAHDFLIAQPPSTLIPYPLSLNLHPHSCPSKHSMATFTDNGNANLQPVCQNCQTSTTPLWRRDEIGSVLCNACGLFLKLHGTARPISLKTDVIKSRNRVKSSAHGQKKKVAKAGDVGPCRLC